MKNKIKKLDKIFSEFIRLRDANEDGYCKCISCGKYQHWKAVDNGHYINRKHINTRFNEKNCNAQCRACNRFDEGNMSGYTLGLIKKYGKNIIEILIASKNMTKKYSIAELDILINFYSDENKKNNKKNRELWKHKEK